MPSLDDFYCYDRSERDEMFAAAEAHRQRLEERERTEAPVACVRCGVRVHAHAAVQTEDGGFCGFRCSHIYCDLQKEKAQ